MILTKEGQIKVKLISLSACAETYLLHDLKCPMAGILWMRSHLHLCIYIKLGDTLFSIRFWEYLRDLFLYTSVRIRLAFLFHLL